MVGGAVLDSKPYVEHDALIGHRYVAKTRSALPRPGGGTYEMVINAAGIRSTREYSKKKPSGVFRVLVLGDSYAAGQFVSNEQRFTELLERRMPNLEVINFALEGTGTDQQLLIYENVASQYEHDLVMLFPFLQNIRRNLVEARVARHPMTGGEVLRAKPRFELLNGHLVLHNVPVPADLVEAAQDPRAVERTDVDRTWSNRLKGRLSASAIGRSLKRMVFALKSWEPFPEYASAHTSAWQLMEAILKRFHAHAMPRPFVLVPVFYDSYVRFRMALNYLDRFRSLEGAGVHVIDLLPHFQALGPEAVRCFQEPYDTHFSASGHLLVATALVRELQNRGLLPPLD